ncbi:cupin domain-containing protein [Opitutus terrae]|uniref:Cupin 2 conserved barrel domain protein n=1 Tax=Opitutus terrae (strain DSM 11246 / JCM 15787 / PB90-1) TaxID=452637 RepID=B1ZYB5_OPITP|nr:cupin domain-containing protein [Opitutus terrae]ACB77013.1 Cupin 2 conserved barrel domain protein [Opitutus terrae PB90-1]
MTFPSLPALALLPLIACATLAAEKPAADKPMLGSKVFKWEELVVKPTEVGERRDVAANPTPTMTELECHISMLKSGLTSHPPHVHPQEELIILTEGELEVYINGATSRIGPGSLFYFSSWDAHNVRSVGAVPARYHVFNFLTPKTRSNPPYPAATSAAPAMIRSQVFSWDKLPVEKTKVGFRREVLDGPTPTYERIRCHVTTLNAHEAPHPAHHHPVEEVIMVKEGALDVTINGRTERASTGSVCFFASNDEHGLKNAGDAPVTYYVIRVDTEATPKAASL